MTFKEQVISLYIEARNAAKHTDAISCSRYLQDLCELFQHQHDNNDADDYKTKAYLAHKSEVFGKYATVVRHRGFIPIVKAFFGFIEAPTGYSFTDIIKDEPPIEDTVQPPISEPSPPVEEPDPLLDGVFTPKNPEPPVEDTPVADTPVIEPPPAPIEPIDEPPVETPIEEAPLDTPDCNTDAPMYLKDFIGQTRVIQQISEAITVAKKLGEKCIANKGGVLLTGPKGLGKTTIMRIIGNELGLPCYIFDASKLANDVKSQRKLDRFLEDIAKKGQPCVIGIDEIHRLNDAQQSMLLTLLQDRHYSNIDDNGQVIDIPIKQFTFIGATTDPQDLLETVHDRFLKGFVCELVEYTHDELVKIITQKVAFIKRMPVSISAEAVEEIIARSRSSIRVVEGYIDKLYRKAILMDKTIIDTELTNMLFSELSIDQTGLYDKDLEILNALYNAPSHIMSEENLSNAVGIKLAVFQGQYKPYLVRRGFLVSINRGQSLTEKAIKYLHKDEETPPAL